MSRRSVKSKASKKGSLKKPSNFLDPSMDEIQAYIEAEMEGDMATQLPMIIKKGSKSLSGGAVTVPNYLNGGSGHSSYGGGGWVQTPACAHKGDSVVFQVDGKFLYGSSWQGLDEFSDQWDLIIDLAGNVKPLVTFQFSGFVRAVSNVPFMAALKELIPKPPPPKQITAQLLSLDWNDMGVPPVELDFWQELWANLPQRTVVACHGGHGRTGSCLVALRIVAGASYWDALKEVRENHCKKAVESFAQEKYLHQLYLRRLEFDLDRAFEADPLADLSKMETELSEAEENPPSLNTSTGSKVYHSGGQSSAVTAADSAFMGAPVQTRTIGGITEDLRCTRGGCPKADCKRNEHLSWVKRGEVSTTMVMD